MALTISIYIASFFLFFRCFQSVPLGPCQPPHTQSPPVPLSSVQKRHSFSFNVCLLPSQISHSPMSVNEKGINKSDGAFFFLIFLFGASEKKAAAEAIHKKKVHKRVKKRNFFSVAFRPFVYFRGECSRRMFGMRGQLVGWKGVRLCTARIKVRVEWMKMNKEKRKKKFFFLLFFNFSSFHVFFLR